MNKAINEIEEHNNEISNKNEANETLPLKNYSEENNEIASTAKEKLTFKERLKLVKDNTTVEPVMACYVMPSVLASLAMQNLNLEKACRVNLNFTDEICDALHLRQTENYTFYEDEVQKLTASLQAWKNVIQTALPVLLILFIGAWSDKTGKRKPCMLLPIIGEFLSCLGFMVNTYYFSEWPVEVGVLTEAIFPAITGGWFANIIGVFSYIGDITKEENRTYRVGIANLCMSLGVPIANALSGILLTSVGYYGVFSISASLYLFSLIYGYYYLEEVKKDFNQQKMEPKGCMGHVTAFFDVRSVAETLRVVSKSGPGNRRLRVCFLLIVFCVVCGPITGEYTVMYLFTRYRFKWDEMQFSIWSTYRVVTHLLGTIFSISLFSKYMKLDDAILGIISNVSFVVAGFAYAFARNDLEIYFAPLLAILDGTSFIAMRSIATKLVSGEEFGKMNSLFGLAEATMPLVYGPLYSRVYVATLNILPGAVFILGAILTLPSIAIFGWLYFEHKKDKQMKNTTDLENID